MAERRPARRDAETLRDTERRRGWATPLQALRRAQLEEQRSAATEIARAGRAAAAWAADRAALRTRTVERVRQWRDTVESASARLDEAVETVRRKGRLRSARIRPFWRLLPSRIRLARARLVTSWKLLLVLLVLLVLASALVTLGAGLAFGVGPLAPPTLGGAP